MPFEKEELVKLYQQVASDIVRKRAEALEYVSPYDSEVMAEALTVIYNAGVADGIMRGVL